MTSQEQEIWLWLDGHKVKMTMHNQDDGKVSIYGEWGNNWAEHEHNETLLGALMWLRERVENES